MSKKEKQDDLGKFEYRYSTASIDEIIQYYTKDFTVQNGEIKTCEHWLDVNKQEVVFRLFVKK